MSNRIFNYSFLALILSQIVGPSQICIRESCAPGRPLAETFLHPKRVLYHYVMVVLFSTFIALVVSEIIGGPKFTLGGPAPPGSP